MEFYFYILRYDTKIFPGQIFKPHCTYKYVSNSKLFFMFFFMRLLQHGDSNNASSVVVVFFLGGGG